MMISSYRDNIVYNTTNLCPRLKKIKIIEAYQSPRVSSYF
jgi:hypothetical protein